MIGKQLLVRVMLLYFIFTDHSGFGTDSMQLTSVFAVFRNLSKVNVLLQNTKS